MRSLTLSVGATLCCAAVLTVPTATAQDLFSGIDPDGFDKSVRPQDDLYKHVNGRWLLNTQIPADKSNYGSFTGLMDAAQENIRAIIEDSARNPRNDNERKVGDFFNSFMNVKLIAQRGLAPLRGELEAIKKLETLDAAFAHLGYLQTVGVGGPVAFFVTADPKDSNSNLAAIFQSGTTLPDRDYYLKDDERYTAAREALVDYINQLFQLADQPFERRDALMILELESGPRLIYEVER